jgi:hypothetical protein
MCKLSLKMLFKFVNTNTPEAKSQIMGYDI